MLQNIIIDFPVNIWASMERRKQEHAELQVSEGSGTMVSFRGMQEPGSR